LIAVSAGGNRRTKTPDARRQTVEVVGGEKEMEQEKMTNRTEGSGKKNTS
jgi:hypothetical protein